MADAPAPTAPTASGYVAPRFEPVLELLEGSGADLAGGGCSFAACLDGTLVVDVHAGQAGPGRPWRADTLSVLFSASKGLVATAAMRLCETGALDLDAPVAAYWPEFAAAGKAAVTVRQVLSHTSGVVVLPEHETLLARSWDGSGWDDHEEIGRRLASAEPSWQPGTRHGYHALTFAWLVDQIVRRSDGRSIGQLFRDEIAEPWDLELWIGTPPEHHSRVAALGAFQQPPDIPELAEIRDVWTWWQDPETVGGQTFLASRTDQENLFDHVHTLLTSPRMLATEFGSGGVTGTAASLARMYGGLARGGELDGVRLFSDAMIRKFAAPAASGRDEILRLDWTWALGFHRQLQIRAGVPSSMGPSPEAFGHAGAGGQVGAADPQARVGLGFVRNQPTNLSLLSGMLAQTFYSCL